MIPFIFTKYLQEAFDVPLVIQLTDDEKFFFKKMELEEAHELAIENAKDIIAVGFDVERTFMFTDYDYYGKMYPNIAKIQKLLTANQVRAALGLSDTGEDNIGKYAYTAIQAAPSFSSSFPDIFGPASNVPVLIPCGIDQDPFFRMTRDVAPRMRPEGYLKPAVVHSKFFPALGGANSKMSASDPTSAIFMTDTQDQIATKIRDYAFSGAPKSAEEHKQKGANLEIDVSIAYLNVFLDDDAKFAKIKEAYRTGEMSEAEVKAELIRVVQPLVAEHQAARKAITPEALHKFFTPRPLRCYGKPFAPVMVRPAAAPAPKGGKGAAAAASAGGAAAAKGSDLAKVDIRVGRVVSVARHPTADNLYIEQIDLGEAAPRTVVSGLVKYLAADQIANRLVVVLCNLAPRPLQGVESAGMVLTAESADATVVELLEAPAGAAPGERVKCEGEEGTPDAVPLSRKVLDRVLPELKTNDAAVGVYRGKPLTCSSGPLRAKTVKGGKLK